MRLYSGCMAAMLSGFVATTAVGQTLQGPLERPSGEGPGGHAVQPAAPSHKRARTPRRHAAATLPRDTVPGPTPPPPSSGERTGAPDAPVSLGFKWQGSNDTAEKTRVQNYGGDAVGTGAAVGLKLHF